MEVNLYHYSIDRFIDMLQCPDCRSKIINVKTGLTCVSCKRHYHIDNGIPMMLPSKMSSEMKTTISKWNQNYLNWTQEGLSKLREDFYSNYLDDILKDIESAREFREEEMFCEIGCGPSWIGMEMAKKGYNVVAFDCSIEALKLAKKIYTQNGVKGFFICGDVCKSPFKENLFHLTYGGGVLEHFDDTQEAVDEIYRITARGGSAFNTVPYLSVSSLTYRQRWGNIPDLPVLKQIAEIVHIRLLKGKYMIFGYEKSFTMNKLGKTFSKAGFYNVKIEQYRCHLPINFIKNEYIKVLIRKLALNRLFWPMVYIIACKH